MEQAYYYRHFAGRNTIRDWREARGCGQSSHVSYRHVAACQQAVQSGKNYSLCCRRPSQRLAGGPDSASSATCRKSGSFASDKRYITTCYHRGKGRKSCFFAFQSAAGFAEARLNLSARGSQAIEIKIEGVGWIVIAFR